MANILGPNVSTGPVPFQSKVEIEFNPGGSANSVAGSSPELRGGVPSLFNPYAVVVFPILGDINGGGYSRLYDGGVGSAADNIPVDGSTPNGASLVNVGNKFSTSKVPTIVALVEDEKLARNQPYYYTDFLYCKYVGLIPNNQLITLRRYGAPAFDNLAVPGQLKDGSGKNRKKISEATDDILVNPGDDHFYPIAQAVTWFGEETGNKLSDLLSFSVQMNWKQFEAEVNTYAGNEQGNQDSPLPKVAQWVGILTGQVNTPFTTANSQFDPYNNGPYAHRVYGPVNVINKTYKRDRGLDFKQSLTLNFEYSLKSIGNINPRAAMLDLMSNLLALTYNNAAFWGGANRYFPQKPTYPFLGGKDGQNAWYRAEPGNFLNAVKNSLYVSDGNGKKKLSSALGEVLSNLASDPIGTLKSIASGAAKLGMIEMGKGRSPAIVSIKSLLTGEPVGEWHMTIGNPFDPIAMMGNLICTEAKFSFNDVLGADNFPTELKCSITVEHGRPRDAGDIQSMFNRGQGRIYYPPIDQLDVLNSSSSTTNSKNDTSWRNGSPAKSNRKVGLFSGSAAEFDNLVGKIRNTERTGTDVSHNARKLPDLMFLRTAGGQTKTDKGQ